MDRTQIAGSTSFHGRRSRARVNDYDTHARPSLEPENCEQHYLFKNHYYDLVQSTTPNDVIAASS
jgi:hypothetical protein